MQTYNHIDLNELAQIVHQANIKWWQNVDTGEPLDRNKRELLSLIISEVSEALEGERKDLMDDKLPNRKMAEVEMADCYIRLLDFAAGYDYSIFRKDFYEDIPDNKGEALFELVCMIVPINSGEPSTWISWSVTYLELYCNKYGYDLKGAFAEKMAYNATREDHTHEARKIAGGKQF